MIRAACREDFRKLFKNDVHHLGEESIHQDVKFAQWLVAEKGNYIRDNNKKITENRESEILSTAHFFPPKMLRLVIITTATFQLEIILMANHKCM